MAPQRQPVTFDAVYAEYRDRIYRYLYRLANGDAAGAEDVAQETWLRVYASLGQLQDADALRGWLYTIAQREWLRAQRSPLKTTPMSNQPGTEELADHSAARQIDQIAIQQCLAQLSEELRSALILVQMEQFTHREAAAILGRPPGTISYQVAEGLRRLRKMLVDEGSLAAAAPLGLLESELARWGHQREPGHLHRRIRAAVAAAPAPAPGTAPPPDAARGPRQEILRRLLGRRSHRWLGAAVVALLLLLVTLRLPGPRRRAGTISYPQLVLDQAVATRSLHALGTDELFQSFIDDAQTIPTQTAEYWYVTPPVRYRLEIQRPGTRTGALSDLTVFQDGQGERRLIQVGTGRVQAMPPAAVSLNAVTPLAFADPGSPLCRLLREQGERLPVLALEENGTALRLLTVEQRQRTTGTRWSLYLKERSGEVARAEIERFGLGPRGLRRTERVRLNQIIYNPPVAAELFSVPAPNAPLSK